MTEGNSGSNNIMTTGHDSDTAKKKKWEDMIDQSVHTTDDVDIGDIEALSRDFIVVKRGYLNEHYYYIPTTKVECWDGEVLWLEIKEDEVKSKYERQIVPDPSRYYIKGDYSGYSATFSELKTIPPKYEKLSSKAVLFHRMTQIDNMDVRYVRSYSKRKMN